MNILIVGASIVQAVVPAIDIPERSGDPCASLPKRELPSGVTARKITVEDQVTMDDIGRVSPGPAPSPFSVSPDGSRVVFRVKRANPETNSYCQRLMVTGVDGSSAALEIDRGGEFIRDDFPLREFAIIMAGWDKPNTPLWSPNGNGIAYLRRENGSTQVWVADPSGKLPARQVTALIDDVDGFAWARGGKALIVATRPQIRAKLAAIRNEGRRGYLFDDRFSPQFADHPLPTGDIPYVYTKVAIKNGATSPATSEEKARLVPARPGAPETARGYAAGPSGSAAWLEPKNPEFLLSPTRLVIERPDGRRSVCETLECEGIRGLWWAENGRALFIMQSTGWARSQMALQRWDMGDPAPTPIVITNDVFTACDAARNELVCTREGSVQPRRLVAIDMKTGRERIVHDPNPHFQHLRLGSAERFHFRNAQGVESFADLVLPPDHRPGVRHPLVVVQYRSDGFLRGGTGDEVPIQPLAAQGFAVLSFDRPDFLPEVLKATTELEMRTLSGDPWADRKQVLSALEIAIDHAVDTGAVDPERMGISGFSDGSTTAGYAILNTDLFKVASMGSCCEDLYALPLAAGPYFTDYLRAMGYRYFEPGTEKFWKEGSIILNADRIGVPILVQNSDTEYEGGLDVVEALTHRGKPIELFVFPDEPHVKYQPAHRRAMYERNIEWFAFWLQGEINCAPSRAAQYDRWRAMSGAPARSTLRCMGSSPGP